MWAALAGSQGWHMEKILGGTMGLINVALMVAVIAVGIVLGVRRPSRALLFGVGAWFAAMFFARWTTYAYFAGIAPVMLLVPFADRLAEHPEHAAEGEQSPLPHQAGGGTPTARGG